MENIILYGSILVALLAFAFAVWLYLWVKRQPCENQKILKATGLIRAGARTFLRKEYGVLAKFASVAAVLIFVFLPKPVWQGDSTPHKTKKRRAKNKVARHSRAVNRRRA